MKGMRKQKRVHTPTLTLRCSPRLAGAERLSERSTETAAMRVSADLCDSSCANAVTALPVVLPKASHAGDERPACSTATDTASYEPSTSWRVQLSRSFLKRSVSI